MKLKKEYFILFIIIIALVLYLVFRRQDRIQYELPDIKDAPVSEISKIEIKGKKDISMLKRSDKTWTIGAEEYPADINKIERILDFIGKPVLITMVSDSENYTRYGLDEENRITVIAYSGDTQTRSIDIGYSVPGHDYTFIRLKNDHRVYHARNKMRELFEEDIDKLRDKLVLSFDRDEISSISIQKQDMVYTMTLEEVSPGPSDKDTEPEKPQKSWKDLEGNDLDETIPDQILSTLVNLKCESYVYEYKKEDLNNPIFFVTLNGEKEYKVSIYEKNAEEEDYPATSSESPYPFIMSGWKAEKLIKIMDKNEKTE